MRLLLFLLLIFLVIPIAAQPLLTPFEASGGAASATYFQCIDFYRKLAAAYPTIHLQTEGATDAGYPLHLVLYSATKQFSPAQWNRKKQLVILINNGIHPGEPDGIDASMMLLRDAASGKIKVPENVILAVIPVYNIGGALNRNSTSRVNQNGPLEYGFRGNSKNLDLNRDFTKADSREAHSFAQLFHRLDPNILIDTHVSDGADYQHTMTLLSTQYDKLGGALGAYFRDTLDPALYRSMDSAGWPMVPYVNVEDETPDKGWKAFYDPPRFSSGYAALFQCIAWVPETHMLKPFDQRVKSTYTLLQLCIAACSARAKAIIRCRETDRLHLLYQQSFSLVFAPDTSRATYYPFSGYEAAYKKSDVTGLPRMYYDHSKPFTKRVPVYDYYQAANPVTAPEAYIIPQAWDAVITRLKENNVVMHALPHDTDIAVTAYKIVRLNNTLPAPYESHYRHTVTAVSAARTTTHFLKGDYLVPTQQQAKRFIIEMLEPEGPDSYFAWNFFDAVLQRKESYSDYRWEDVAADYLHKNPAIRQALDEEIARNPEWKTDAAAQLLFVYQHSPFFEPGYLRYPVFRIGH